MVAIERHLQLLDDTEEAAFWRMFRACGLVREDVPITEFEFLSKVNFRIGADARGVLREGLAQRGLLTGSPPPHSAPVISKGSDLTAHYADKRPEGFSIKIG